MGFRDLQTACAVCDSFYYRGTFASHKNSVRHQLVLVERARRREAIAAERRADAAERRAERAADRAAARRP
jgi:hypothetical protein